MKGDWIKIHRSLSDGKKIRNFWFREKFTWGQAWIDLLLNAQHSPSSFWTPDKKEIKLKRGQIGMSQLTMAKRWRWSRGKVGRYLVWLKNERMIEQAIEQSTTVITICNYSEYQDKKIEREHKTGQPAGHPTGHPTDTQQDTYKNDKKEKKEKKENIMLTVGRPRVSRMHKKIKTGSGDEMDEIGNLGQRLLALLNRKTGKNFEFTRNGKLTAGGNILMARLADYAADEIATVIGVKCEEWMGTEFEKYLRPATLFNKTKFESYLAQCAN